MTDEDTKPELSKTEAWLSGVASLGAILTAYLSHMEGAATWVALGVCAFMAGIYAFSHTTLASADRPGIKTKAFWSSVVVIVASTAAAIAETGIAGVPAGVVQIAGMISAAATAVGYNIWRYKKKAVDGSRE